MIQRPLHFLTNKNDNHIRHILLTRFFNAVERKYIAQVFCQPMKNQLPYLNEDKNEYGKNIPMKSHLKLWLWDTSFVVLS